MTSGCTAATGYLKGLAIYNEESGESAARFSIYIEENAPSSQATRLIRDVALLAYVERGSGRLRSSGRDWHSMHDPVSSVYSRSPRSNFIRHTSLLTIEGLTSLRGVACSLAAFTTGLTSTSLLIFCCPFMTGFLSSGEYWGPCGRLALSPRTGRGAAPFARLRGAASSLCLGFASLTFPLRP